MASGMVGGMGMIVHKLLGQVKQKDGLGWSRGNMEAE